MSNMLGIVAILPTVGPTYDVISHYAVGILGTMVTPVFDE